MQKNMTYAVLSRQHIYNGLCIEAKHLLWIIVSNIDIDHKIFSKYFLIQKDIFIKIITFCILMYAREKERYLTQSYDKSPYTHRKIQ